MARGEKLKRESRAASKAARDAGIAHSTPLTLQVVDRRRSQLWTISIFVVTVLTVAIAVFSLSGDFVRKTLDLANFSSWAIVVFVGGLALAFLIYVIEKERSLRRLARLLIEERVLSAALSNRLAEISALSEVGKAINTTLDIEDVFDLILSSAINLLGGSEGSIMLVDPGTQRLTVVSAKGVFADQLLGQSQAVGEGVAGRVAERRSPMLIQGRDLEDDIDTIVVPERSIYSSMSVPLVRRDELVGVLNLNETDGKTRFSEEDLGALGLFAEHAAVAIGNARLFETEKETVSRLEELDRLKSDFVASVSHELKTPLTAIIGAAKTVSRGGSTMPEADRMNFIGMIERQGNRLLKLVEDVLTTARIESGPGHLRREMLDLRELAESVIVDFSDTLIARNRTISLEVETERPTVWGDGVAVRQVISNLLENAVKYSDENTPVTIVVMENSSEAVIEIRDQGRGISDDHIKRIFERFRQLDSSSSRRAGGFGLGLFIVKNLVEQHGGSVEVESSVGVGTTFRVRLPKRARPLPPPPPPTRFAEHTPQIPH